MKKFIIASMVVVAAVALGTSRAQATLLLSEDFNSYTNGPLVGNVSSGWANFSGTAGTLRILSGQASLTASSSEDAGTNFNGGVVHSNDVLYASFDVNLSALPQGNLGNGGNGTYFFMFKDTSTSQFRDRVWVSTNNAALGSFRIGIGNSSAVMTNLDGNPVFVSTDLSLGTTYKIAVRMDQTGLVPSCTLWLDPLGLNLSVTATDTFANVILAATQIALRQATTTVGAGTETVDNILVGTTFADVIPEPSTVLLVGAGLLGLLAVRRRRS